MIRYSLIALIVISLNLSIAYSNNTEKYRVGVFGAYTQSLHDVSFRKLDGIPNCCPSFETGSGWGLSYGLSFVMPVYNMLGFEFRSGIYDNSGLLRSVESEVISVDYKPVMGDYEHTIDATIRSLGISTGIRITPIEKLNISIGTIFDVLLTSKFEQQEKIIKPSDRGKFLNTGTSVRNEYSGEIPGANSMANSMYMAISYDLPMNSQSTLVLSPEIAYTHAISNIVLSAPWKINSLNIGVAIHYIINNPPVSEPLPDIEPEPGPELITETEILLEPKLKVTGNQQQNEDEIDIVIFDEIVQTELQPLLNYIFFDNKSDKIPDRYKLLKTEKAAEFTTESLPMGAVLENYYHILNIIGLRMTKYPNANITLNGCNSGKADELAVSDLSKNRAQAVKDYLTSVWNIGADRILLKSRNLPEVYSNPDNSAGVEENRRVEIASDVWEILAPLEIVDSRLHVSPSEITILPEIKNSKYLKEWTITAKIKDDEVFAFSGATDLDKSYKADFTKVANNASAKPEYINFSFKTLSSESDTPEEYQKSIKIQSNRDSLRNSKLATGARTDKYSLILFPYKSTNISPDNQRIFDMINQRLSNNSQLIINGYTDELGDEEFNKELSKKRAENVYKLLGHSKAKYSGKGETGLLYDNSIPEGRFYCRTVEIVVYTQPD